MAIDSIRYELSDDLPDGDNIMPILTGDRLVVAIRAEAALPDVVAELQELADWALCVVFEGEQIGGRRAA